MERMAELAAMAHNNKIVGSSHRAALKALTMQVMLMVSVIGSAGAALVYSTAVCAEEAAATDGATPEKKAGFVDGAMGSTLDYFGFNHTRVDNLHSYYVGLGDTNSLLHVGIEAPTQFGHVYAKVGEFANGKTLAGQVGFRMPYLYVHEKDNDGVYFGAYAGDIENAGINGKHRNRLGAALEMSYLLLNKTSLTAASVSIGFAKTDKNGELDQQKVSPILMFGLTWGFGVF